MQVAVVLPAKSAMRWHSAVGETLAAIPGVSVRLAAAPEREPLPAALDLLLRLERLVHRLAPGGAAEPHPADGLLPAAAVEGADLVVDLTGGEPAAGDTRRLVLRCGGRRPELGAAEAILAGRPPVLTADLGADGVIHRVAAWVVATEDRTVLATGLGDVLGRAVQLVRAAAGALAAGVPPAALDLGIAMAPAADAGASRAPALHLADGLVARVRGRLGRLLGQAPRWHVGWRPAVGPAGLPDLAAGPFRPLPDGGNRFFADPFPWSRDGRTVLLMEELPFATGKGVISAVEVAADGTLSEPKVVLEEGCHLSYPFLVEDGGALFMIPETSTRRTVELWRCVRFPDRWERDAVLVTGEDLSDATVFRTAGGWAMLAASRERWCSTWDALDLWIAPALEGPWTRAGSGPVLVDVRAARPAGWVFDDGGRRIRPVQDCAAGYGAGLAFAAFEIGEDGRFRQTLLRRDRPSAPWRGLHTYNRAAGIEVIDVFGPVPGADIAIGEASAMGSSPD